MHGFLNIHKPQGLTSRDVVNRVQRLVKPAKVGHCGTLDPLATGVLVVAVGQATRLVEYVQAEQKFYRGTFLLGRTSDTEDIFGQVVELGDARQPTREELEALLPKFRGNILQRPPAFSALKVAGKRAYNLARAGKEVELAPRPIEVFALEIAEFEYPRLVLEIVCSGGTYVRSLGRDIAEAAGTGAVMKGLVRGAIGPFTLANAIEPEQLNSSADVARGLWPLSTAVIGIPRVALNSDQIGELKHGRQIVLPEQDGAPLELAAYDVSGDLVALLVPRGAGHWGPSRVFMLD